ncbi:MAG: choice-of-anchor Q domain-containing protein [Verrucomicrobiota bacterium]
MKNHLMALLRGMPAALIPTLLMQILAGWATASAQVVANISDSGPGTLRSALTNAVNGAVITFNPSLSGATITLSNTLAINTNLTIDASALPGGIRINGNHSVQIFIVAHGTSNVLNSLTLTNGYSSENGGGIENNGTLMMNECTVSGNGAAYGGGIYNSGNTLSMANCIVSGNSAKYGGGICINNRETIVTMNQCTFSGNIASGSGNGIGGGIYDEDGMLTLTNCTFAGNHAAYYGGGIANESAAAILNECTLSENDGDAGGGIDNSGTLTLNRCTLSGNTSSGGGGVYNDGIVILTTCALSGNSAADGGGIENRVDGTLTMTNCTLLGNSAEYGGGIYIYNSDETIVTLDQCTVSGNSASDEGGGIENAYGTLTVNQCTLSGNSANENGGGIDNYGTAVMTNTIVAGNTAVSGADIYNDGGDLTYGTSNLVPLVDNNGGFISGPAPVTNAPDLAPLGNYGGPTQTMPPLPGSPAIGAGSVAANTFSADQRGYPRTQSGLIDLGAVELPTVPPFTASPTNDWQFHPVQFSSTNIDSDGSAIVNWKWSFGDTQTGAGQNPAHVYSTTGMFSQSLVVTNSLGLALGVTGPSITVLPPLKLTGLSRSGANLVLSGANGASGQTYSVLVSTNPALPLSQWTPLTINSWIANGAFNLTVNNALDPSVSQQFFLLKVP